MIQNASVERVSAPDCTQSNSDDVHRNLHFASTALPIRSRSNTQCCQKCPARLRPPSPSTCVCHNHAHRGRRYCSISQPPRRNKLRQTFGKDRGLLCGAVSLLRATHRSLPTTDYQREPVSRDVTAPMVDITGAQPKVTTLIRVATSGTNAAGGCLCDCLTIGSK